MNYTSNIIFRSMEFDIEDVEALDISEGFFCVNETDWNETCYNMCDDSVCGNSWGSEMSEPETECKIE